MEPTATEKEMTRKTLLAALVLSSFVVAMSACDSGGEGDSAPSGSHAAPTKGASGAADAATAEATKIFQTRCTPCHGPSGHGDGPTGKALTPPPRNLSDAAWQKSVDDAYLERIIQLGGAAVGKSPAMPPNPDLTDKPEVLKALRAKVRSFAAN